MCNSVNPEDLNKTKLEQFSCVVESVLYHAKNVAAKKAFQDKGLVIAIEGEWGSGKSFFLDVFERKIKDQANFIAKIGSTKPSQDSGDIRLERKLDVSFEASTFSSEERSIIEKILGKQLSETVSENSDKSKKNISFTQEDILKIKNELVESDEDIKKALNRKLKNSVKPVIILKYNAWEDDYFDDPFVSLVGQLHKQVSQRTSLTISYFEPEEIRNLKEIVQKVTSFALSDFSPEDIKNLKKLVDQDFPKIQSINPEKPDYKSLSFTREEISAIQTKLQQNNPENLSAKLVKMLPEIKDSTSFGREEVFFIEKDIQKIKEELYKRNDDISKKLTDKFMKQLNKLKVFQNTASIIIKTAFKIVAPQIVSPIIDMLTTKGVGEPLSSYLSLKEKKEKFKESLSALGGDSTLKIVIIDELDRCKPDYAVKVLEIIKHFFNVDNVAFIMAVDKKQLIASIHQFYGNKYDAELYLARFFDFELKLPSNNDAFQKELVEHNFQEVTKYSENQQEGNIENRYNLLQKLIKLFGMTPREQATFSQRLNILLYQETLPDIPYYVLIALHTIRATEVNDLILKMKNINIFNDITERSITTAFNEFLESLSSIARINKNKLLETIYEQVWILFFRFIQSNCDNNEEKETKMIEAFKSYHPQYAHRCELHGNNLDFVLALLCYL